MLQPKAVANPCKKFLCRSLLISPAPYFLDYDASRYNRHNCVPEPIRDQGASYSLACPYISHVISTICGIIFSECRIRYTASTDRVRSIDDLVAAL